MHKVTLRNPDQILPMLQRQGDFFIMEHIVASQDFSKEDMIQINRCCMAFRAMTAADVLTGDGIRVTQNAINLRRLSRPSSTWDWPNECPSNKDVSRWKSGLTRITSANFSLPFISKLEHWIEHPHLRWQWFYLRHERHLYHQTNGAWHHYAPFSARSTVAFKRVGIVSSPPVPVEDLERATIQCDRGRVMFEGSAGNSYTPPPTYDTIYDFIANWEDSWPLRKVTSWRTWF